MPKRSVRRRPTAKKPWEELGMSKSSYYRQRQRRSRPAPVNECDTGPAEDNLDTIARNRIEAEATYRARHDVEAAVARAEKAEAALDESVSAAVDAALVTTALAMLDAVLNNVINPRGLLTLYGTVPTWAACARALRKAGY